MSQISQVARAWRATPREPIGSKSSVTRLFVTRLWPDLVRLYLVVMGVTVCALSQTGCPADAADVRPPGDEFYFPTGLAKSGDEKTVFVINANSDLRFASGGIVEVDVDDVVGIVRPWVDGGDVASSCERDTTLGFTINCPETLVTIPEAAVRLASFSTQIEVQALANGSERLFVASRGDPSVTYVDFDPDDRLLYCGGSGTQPSCDDDHRVTLLRDDPDIGRLVEEPFGLFVDSIRGYVMVTHLTSGTVTLLDAPADGRVPIVSDVITGIFAADPATGVRGAVGVAGRRPGEPRDLVYVTSRSESRVQLLSVARPSLDGLPRISTADFFFLNQVLPSDDSREIAFGAGGNRAYIVNREPPLLHVIDTSDGPGGQPVNRFLGGVELCAEAANLTVLDSGRGERVYVSCFRNGQVWVIDPVGRVVEAVVNVGRGPNSLIGLSAEKLVLVSNFLEDTISVIDVAPESPLENRFVVRLGFTRQSESK